jgi:hypothetical protein
MSKLYVGLKIATQSREVFRADETPTEASHGAKYDAVIGPFRTKRAAVIMATYGGNNPHLLCVADAERMAKREHVTGYKYTCLSSHGRVPSWC